MYRNTFIAAAVFGICFQSVCVLCLCASPTLAEPPVLAQVQDVALTSSVQENAGFGGGMLAVSLAIDGREVVRLLDLDTRRVLQFASNIPNVSFPVFSPSGELVSFVGKSNGGDHIYVSDWTGGGARRVSDPGGRFGDPSWLSDGSGLVFFAELRSGQRELATVSILTGATTSLISEFGGVNTTPVESPRNSAIAYSTNRFFPGWDICFYDRETKIETCPLGNELETFCRPRWSPSGTQIAFSKGVGDSIDLYLYTLASGTIERITKLKNKEYDAVFSPNGKFVAFAYDPKGDEHYEIWIVRLSDKAVFPVAQSRGSLRHLSWSAARPYAVGYLDACPFDDLKIEPGTCGCGLSDRDGDTDGVEDCLDLCPSDPLKVAPGNFGCHQLESEVKPTAVVMPEPTSQVAPKIPRARFPPSVKRRGLGTNKTNYFLSVPTGDWKGPVTFVIEYRSKTFELVRNRRHVSFRTKSSRPVRFAWKRNGVRRSPWSKWFPLS